MNDPADCRVICMLQTTSEEHIDKKTFGKDLSQL